MRAPAARAHHFVQRPDEPGRVPTPLLRRCGREPREPEHALAPVADRLAVEFPARGAEFALPLGRRTRQRTVLL